MTADERTLAEPARSAHPQVSSQQQARAAYNTRLRRWRWIYAAALTAVLAAALVAVKVAYAAGEISHATLRTAAAPAASIAPQAPATAVTLAWSTPDRSALGQPFWGGTVVTATDHAVRGRNALTGAITWSYTRTDRALCDAIQDYGTTIALYALHGNCDEVTALDSQTGARKWTRTLDKDDTRDGQLGDGIKGIQHVLGHPTYSISQYSVLVITPDVIYDLDPGGGLDRWTFGWSGCRIHGAVIGSQGALISQTCTDVPCGKLTFCGNGPQLLLRNGNDARADESKNPTNPDQITWNRIGVDALPVSADQVISATDPGAQTLITYDSTKGTTLGRLQLAGADTPGAIAQVNTARAELVWVGGVTYSVQTSGTDFFWKAPSTGAPTVTPLPGSQTSPVDLSDATVLVPTDAGAAALDPATGAIAQRYPLTTAAGAVYPLGAGFVAAGASTAVYR